MKRFTLASERDTERVARALQPLLRGGVSWGMRGDLGAGKTTFVRYLVSAAGGDTRAVASPTYTLEHEYPLPHGVVVQHWDLYRLTALPLELEERPHSKVVRVIEWPERCPEIQSAIDLSLALINPDTFNESVDAVQSSGARVLEISGPLLEEAVRLLQGVVSEV